MAFRCSAEVDEDEQYCTCMCWIEGMWKQTNNNVWELELMRVCKAAEAAVGQDI